MLKWCSYCQQFIGEIPPYDNFAITHGVCTACGTRALEFTDEEFGLAESLRDIQQKLSEAGRRNDVDAAAKVIEMAAAARVRDVDILLGVIAPLLYQIGEDWKRHKITVADEHRFTAFCNSIYALVVSRVDAKMPAGAAESAIVEILAMNAPGNAHTLAIRFITLWLRSKGVRTQIVDIPLSLDNLTTLVTERQAEMLLISVALPEQRTAAVAIAERMASMAHSVRPRVIVGGNAVKLGLIAAIPEAELMADVGSLIAALGERHELASPSTLR